MSMATIVNGLPKHMLMKGDGYRSQLFCPVCSLVGSRLTLRQVFTRIPDEPQFSDDPDARKSFPGSKVGGRILGLRRVLAVRLACTCGAEFEVTLIPDVRNIRFAFLLGGSEPK